MWVVWEDHINFFLISLAPILIFIIPERYLMMVLKYFAQKKCERCFPKKNKELLLDIHLAAKNCHRNKENIEACKKMVKLMPSLVNKRVPPYGYTPFHRVCSNACTELMMFMLSNGADVNIQSTQGDGPLYLATHGILTGKNLSFVPLQILMDAGCDINAARSNGYTPIHLAARFGRSDLVHWLLENGADPLPNTSRVYPFQCAIKHGYYEIASILAPNDSKDILSINED